jgi:hypothetical protein
MRLIPAFDLEFKNHLSQSLNKNTDMFKYSQSTYDMVDVQTQSLYGTTVQAAQEKLRNIIIRSYTKLGMPIDEIADFVGEDAKKIYDILVAEKLIIA